MRILFADDSMTAQNMGKKILTEAGYEVVAVSNGAAAVKKIAEQKPDIIILDIYMPGYTGLEVCDKIRSSVETLKTPVLLTVGKMEPYRAEDANRVKADGVIIKPFEASDLLAVIKKLEERVVRKTTAVADQTIRLERLPEVEEFTPEASQNHTEMHVETTTKTAPAIVDVPDNMATSAAFSDLLGPEPVHSFEPLHEPQHTPATNLPVEPPASIPSVATANDVNDVMEIPEFTTLPSEDLEEVHSKPTAIDEPGAAQDRQEEITVTSSGAEEFEIEETHFASAIPEETANDKSFAEIVPEERLSSIPETQPIPVYQEPELEVLETATAFPSAAKASTAATSFDVNSAPVEHWEVEETPSPVELRKPAVSVEPVAPPAESPSPARVNPAAPIETVDFDSFGVKDIKEEIETLVSASESRPIQMEVKRPSANGFGHPAPSKEVIRPVDDDFEARVAAAMTIYDEQTDAEIAPAPAKMSRTDAMEGAAEFAVERGPETASYSSPSFAAEMNVEEDLEAPSSFEYSPPVTSSKSETAPVSVAPVEAPEPMAQAVQHLNQAPVRSIKPEPAEVASPVSYHKEALRPAVEAPPAVVQRPVEMPVRTTKPQPAAEIENVVAPRKEPLSSVTEAAPVVFERPVEMPARTTKPQPAAEIENVVAPRKEPLSSVTEAAPVVFERPVEMPARTAKPQPAAEIENVVAPRKEPISSVTEAAPVVFERPVEMPARTAKPQPAAEIESTISSRQEPANSVVEAAPVRVQRPVEMPVRTTKPQPAAEIENIVPSHKEPPSSVVEAAPVVFERPVETPARTVKTQPVAEIESTVSSRQEMPRTVAEAAAVPTQTGIDQEKIIGEIESQLSAPPDIPADSSLNTQVIASAVHRVLERLKPHLIDEISRELKNNKE